MVTSERKNNYENHLYSVVQDQKLKTYVENHIKALDCKRYVEHDGRCSCGRQKKDHHYDVSGSGGPWDKKKDLTEISTNAYGEMKLRGFRVLAGVNLKYIRASETIDLNMHLYHIMTKIWEFQKPELVISINGGAKKMIPLSTEQKSAFKRGLVNVSKSASVWIITGGFNFGVSKLVGEAARDYNIASQDKTFIVLGIGTWGAVYNRHDLILEDNKQRIIYNNVEGQFNLKGQAPLDPNHDAFILFDSGVEGVFGKEIQFRAEFEMFIAQQANCSVVQVIVEGGKKCVSTADESLKQGIPVVVMKGSKRAADLICDVIESDETSMMDIIDQGLSVYKEEWTIVDDAEMEKLKESLRCLHVFRKNKLVHIFSMSDFTKNLDRAILEAAFSGKINGKELTTDEKLKLAMTFNRSDVAEECIFESSKSRTEFADYGEYIQKALVRNQWKFVSMFISRGTQVESFLTKSLLEKLYFGRDVNRHLNSNTANMFRYMLDHVRHPAPSKLSTIGKVLRKLTQNLVTNMYNDSNTSGKCCCTSNVDVEETVENETITDFDKYIEPIFVTKTNKNEQTSCMCCHQEYSEKQYVYTKHPPRNKGGRIIYTEQDLFIWSLLTQRWEMAKIFLENGKDHIGSALVASVICRSMGQIANEEGEVEMMGVLTTYKEFFENLAINILSEAYWRDKTRTHLLLSRALPYWGRLTCMEIANKHKLINFLSHSACQTRLNYIWLGGMSMYMNTFIFLLNLPLAFLTSKTLIFGNRKIEEYDEKVLVDCIKEDSVDSDISRESGLIKQKSVIDLESLRKPTSNRASRKEKEYLTEFRRKQQITMQNVSFCKAVSLYYNAPITKFTMHIISYFLFLTIFTYVLLVELLPLSSVTTISQRQMEYAVYTYIAAYVLEEIRQTVSGNQFDSCQDKLYAWISSLWNVFDLFMYVIFFIGVICRHITTIDFVYARTLFSLSLSMFYVRFLQFYYANRSLGPKVIAVTEMIKDIVFFLALYVIAIFAYGTFAQALLFSNSPINSFLLKNIIYYPYFQSYGDLHLEYVEGTVSQNNVTPTPNAIVIVAFALFMLFTNALLMNLLVAMFSMTIQNVEDNANRIWAFNRFNLIEEFYFRPILPEPLNFIEIFWKFFRAMRCNRQENEILRTDDLVVNLVHEEDLLSAGFEQQCMETYLIDNPLLTPTIDRAQTEDNKEVDKSTSSAIAEKNEKDELTDQLIKSLLEDLKEVKLEIKATAAKIHKIRRHQKKGRNMSRSSTTVGNIQKVLPIDDDENY